MPLRIVKLKRLKRKQMLLWQLANSYWTDVSKRLLYSFHWLAVQPITLLHVWRCCNQRREHHRCVSFMRTCRPGCVRRCAASVACLSSVKQHCAVYMELSSHRIYTFHLRLGNWIDRVFGALTNFSWIGNFCSIWGKMQLHLTSLVICAVLSAAVAEVFFEDTFQEGEFSSVSFSALMWRDLWW